LVRPLSRKEPQYSRDENLSPQKKLTVDFPYALAVTTMIMVAALYVAATWMLKRDSGLRRVQLRRPSGKHFLPQRIIVNLKAIDGLRLATR
jgi:hypothetical protein